MINSIYIYGIIEETEPQRFPFSGIEDAEVYTINQQNLAAVVSDTTLKEIDPTRKNVHTHTVVQAGVLKSYTLLPLAFGTSASSREEVQKLLEKNYAGLLQELERLRDKIEVEVKVSWDSEAMSKHLQSRSQEMTRIKAKLNTAVSPLESRSLLEGIGKQIERIALDWKDKYAQRAYATLKGLSLEARLNNPVGIRNLLNASFLIDRSKEKEFREEVYKLDSQYQGRVNFKYVSPLPPYNFVLLKLEPLK